MTYEYETQLLQSELRHWMLSAESLGDNPTEMCIRVMATIQDYYIRSDASVVVEYSMTELPNGGVLVTLHNGFTVPFEVLATALIENVEAAA